MRRRTHRDGQDTPAEEEVRTEAAEDVEEDAAEAADAAACASLSDTQREAVRRAMLTLITLTP